jgi:hypothetical protein
VQSPQLSIRKKKMFEVSTVIRLNTAAVKASMRCTGVAIAICSWFALSNHCAFAAVATKTDSVQAECPFHSKPAKQKQGPSQLQCCKILRAVVLAQTKSWARDDAKSFDVDLLVGDFVLGALLPNAQASLLPLDTGPPDVHSFAELILQRSLLTHAPPFRAWNANICVLVVGQPLRLPFSPAGRRGACPTTRQNEKRNCSSSRERSCAGRTRRQRAGRSD